MTIYYAQASAVWSEANWNDQADGQGNPGIPQAGDQCEANTYSINCAGVSTNDYTLTTTNGGTYYSNKWWADNDGTFGSATWRCAGGSSGFTGTPEAGHTCLSNAHMIDCRSDSTLAMSCVLSEADGGAFWFSLADAIWPNPADVSTVEAAYGPTGAEYAGTLDLSLYTLTSGIVWPAAANVSDVETAWGPTGAEYAGTLDLSLYVLIASVVDAGWVVVGHDNYTGGSAGTYPTTAATNAAHLAADVATLNDHLDEMIPANTAIKAHYVGVLDGTATSGGIDPADIVAASWVVVGHNNYVGGDAGTYPTTATSQAAQLMTDQAEVAGFLENIDGGTTILGQVGTGVNATTIRTALGIAEADLDDQLDAILAASGGSSLTAQEVRDAMKLAPTAGDPEAGSVDKHLDDILADSNELQVDWANGGRLDLLLDAAVGGAGGTYAQTITVTAGGVAKQGVTVQILDAADDSIIDTGTTNSSGVAILRCNTLSVKFSASKAGYTSYTSAATSVTGAAARPITLTAIGTIPAPTTPGTVTGYGYCRVGTTLTAGVLIYVKQITPGSRNIYDATVVTLTSDAGGLVSCALWADGSTYQIMRTGGAWSAEFRPAEDTVGGGTYLLPGLLGT